MPVQPPPPLEQKMTLEIRTNGGISYSTSESNLTETFCVGVLRAVAAGLHDNLDPSRARLIHKGNVLRDDSLTLAEAGIRDNDSVMLIVGYAAAANDDNDDTVVDEAESVRISE